MLKGVEYMHNTSQDQCYSATFFNFISFRSGTQVRCYMFQLYGSVLSQTFRHKLGHQEKSLRGRWKMLVGVDYRGQLEKAQESCLPMSWSRSTYKMQQCPEGRIQVRNLIRDNQDRFLNLCMQVMYSKHEGMWKYLQHIEQLWSQLWSVPTRGAHWLQILQLTP